MSFSHSLVIALIALQITHSSLSLNPYIRETKEREKRAKERDKRERDREAGRERERPVLRKRKCRRMRQRKIERNKEEGERNIHVHVCDKRKRGIIIEGGSERGDRTGEGEREQRDKVKREKVRK